MVEPPRWRTHGGESTLFTSEYNDALIFGDAVGSAYSDVWCIRSSVASIVWTGCRRRRGGGARQAGNN